MNHFFAKLLLFGEHTVLQGSPALASPFTRFEGIWKFTEAADAVALQQNLSTWLNYLQDLQRANALLCTLDLERFAADLGAGIYFDSNIPTGYGAGSSGALCAALYTRYARDPLPKNDHVQFPLLKKILGQLESFFHGASSGTDPLICYLNQSLLLHPDGTIDSVSVPEWPQEAQGFRFFLLDTGISRSTGPLVEWFMACCAGSSFLEHIKKVHVPLTGEAIALFQLGNWSALWGVMQQISAVQLTDLKPMIPAGFESLWQTGLETGKYTVKLCGAGGGGFLLGMTKSEQDLPPGKIILLA